MLVICANRWNSGAIMCHSGNLQIGHTQLLEVQQKKRQGWVGRYAGFIVVAVVDHVLVPESWLNGGARNRLCGAGSPLSSSTGCFFFFEVVKEKKLLWRFITVVSCGATTGGTTTLVK